MRFDDVVITGVGVVSPVGIGRDAFLAALLAGQSGITQLPDLADSTLRSRIGGVVRDFDPKAYVRPRKSLKVMSRGIQFGFAAADLAWQDAALAEHGADPDRVGVVCGCDMLYSDLQDLLPLYAACKETGQFDFALFGSKGMDQLHPLWMLKNLPNMPACHISIAKDARGPCNSIVQEEVSSLRAVIEGAWSIQRGIADVMLVGGVGMRLQPTSLAWRSGSHLSRRNESPANASRPFDADRDGMVYGEGAAVFVLERCTHAAGRGAKPICRLVAGSSYSARLTPDGTGLSTAVTHSIQRALQDAQWSAANVGHVNAHGVSTIVDDAQESSAIHDVLGDVPVTAPKSYFGNLGAGTGAMELAVSVLAVAQGKVPVTLNYDTPDPACPVNVIADESVLVNQRSALVLNHTKQGHTVAVAIERRE